MFRSLTSVLAAAMIVVTAISVASAQQPPQQQGKSTSDRPATRTSPKKAFAGTLNINTAPAADLQQLPGIGAKTAARIVEYRQKNGPFKKVEELMNVRGVGEKNFLRLKAQITVGQPKAADHGQQQ